MKKVNIHIVLGGAVSAGAYTAGVLDYLMSVIKQWNAKTDKEYEVKISAITGTSAGGMCGSVLLKDLRKGWPYDIRNSPLCEAWIKGLDIYHLSEKDDLIKGEEPKSIFNGRRIREVVNEYVFFEEQSEEEEVGMNTICNEKLCLTLCVTNTRGIAYPFTFISASKHTYSFTNHRDYNEFTLNGANSNLKNEKDWKRLAEITVATGAFPIGLPSPLVERKISEIEEGLGMPNSEEDKDKTIKYRAVDGGAVDNEPLGKIRNFLINKKVDEENVVIMIDPFPFEPSKYEEDKDSLFQMASKALGAVRGQALFKAEEFSQEEMEYTFFIGPSNPNYSLTQTKKRLSLEEEKKNHIAGSALLAFGGFISEKYREFDYKLGLANCDKFIKDYFVFEKGKSTEKKILEPHTDYEYPREPDAWTLPCLSKKEWTEPINAMMGRVTSVVDYYLDEYVRICIVGWLARRLVRKKILKAIREKILCDLKEKKLIKG